MKPIFMVELKDGKTDNIFEYDFKNGVFAGLKKYSYNDVKNFIGIPCEVFSSIFAKEAKKKETSDE